MSEWRVCVEFIIPDDIGIEEWPPEGEFFTSDPIPNPILERLRKAVGEDKRWTLRRIASLRPINDPMRQHLLIWVSCEGLDREEAVQSIRGDIYDVVTDVIPSASFFGIEVET